jgi:hypothetical protein
MLVLRCSCFSLRQGAARAHMASCGISGGGHWRGRVRLGQHAAHPCRPNRLRQFRRRSPLTASVLCPTRAPRMPPPPTSPPLRSADASCSAACRSPQRQLLLAPCTSHSRPQLVDMIVSDLRGGLGPMFYDAALSVDAHACSVASSMDWSHVTISLHASAGLHNLRWVYRGADRVGSSRSEPATVLILSPTSSVPLIAPPPLLLHLSHALNFTSCAAPPFKIFTSSHLRVCISDGQKAQGENEADSEGFCSRDEEVVLSCSASPTAGGSLLDGDYDDDDGSDSHMSFCHCDCRNPRFFRRCLPPRFHRQCITCQRPLVRDQGGCGRRCGDGSGFARRTSAHVGSVAR